MKGRVNTMFRIYFNRRKTYNAIAVVMSMIIAISGMLINFSGGASAKGKVNIGKKKLNMYAGQTYKFKNKKYSWKSSKKSIVLVDRKGRIKAKKPGNAKITASLKVGKKTKKAVCNIKVGRYATGIKLSSADTIVLKVGQTSMVNAKVMPDKVLYNDIEYSSDNVNVVTVDSSGTIRPVSKGTASVSMTTKAVNSKGKKITKSVTVVVTEDPDIDVVTDIPGVNPGEDIFDTTKDWMLDDQNTIPSPTPEVTSAPTSEPTAPAVTRKPGIDVTPEPTSTPVPDAISEYIASLKPDNSSPLVGSFTVKNTQGDYRTVYLLNKNYTGMVKLDIDGYAYSGNDSVLSLLNRLETERMSTTNSSGTVCVHRKPKEPLWTVEFLKTGVKYYFDAHINDTTYGTDYGIVIAIGDTTGKIRISAK